MRLPVNLFLYAMSTGLLGLAGYTFTQSLKESDGLKIQLAGLADQVAAVASKVEDVTMVSKSYRRMIDLS